MFGNKRTGAYLPKMVWTPIVRHVMVKGAYSPNDPALTEYWATRTRRQDIAQAAFLPSEKRILLRMRGHVCPLCGEQILNGEEIHVHHLKRHASSEGLDNKIVMHLYCHQQAHSRKENSA